MDPNKKSKETEEKVTKKPSQHGEEPPTVRTPAKPKAHQVPATEQNAIRPKKKA